MAEKCDFSGWATRANMLCSDGRIIKQNAFKDCDGKTVPLVWNHRHDEPYNVLGHALLKNRGDGVYAYCTFNDTESGKTARLLVEHGDVVSLSIYANKLKQKGAEVFHGVIREVSLVLAGANPGAMIENVSISHGDDEEFEADIYSDCGLDSEDFSHAEEEMNEKGDNEPMEDNKEKTTETKEETIGEIYETFTEKQKKVVSALVGMALEEGNKSDDENKEETTMKQNAFDNDTRTEENVLSHDAMNAIIKDAKRYGTMKESFMQHAEEYGINQIDYLFPDAKTVTNVPTFIQRDMSWVKTVMNGVHHTPFARIKSVFADITEDDARAKGYLKGKLKKEEVFSLLKRTTTPTTVYKKQKMDRDDVVDITDFDVVSWLKSEMRMMLDEELARAILVGDGRLASSDDKINEQNIRPIWKDAELYTITKTITVQSSATDDDKAKAFIKEAIKARKDYKGSGTPDLFTTEDMLTNMLLLTDTMGRDLYDSVEKLAKKLRVRNIVTVPVMEGLTTNDGDALMGIIVNLADYNVGADKGGAVNMFDDFDIDFNQQKYLIETRCSGALIKPYSAIAINLKVSG